MQKINDAKLITCILKKGKALPLMEALNQKGISKINFAFARGSELQDDGGKVKEKEKEIVTIIADNSAQAEELF